MSKLEVNQIDKTPTGTEVTVLSDLHLNQELVLAEYTTAQINAIQNPNDGALVWDSEEGTVKVYKESSGVWVQVGGTESAEAETPSWPGLWGASRIEMSIVCAAYLAGIQLYDPFGHRHGC